MDASVAVLLGALVGAAAGIAGQFLTARFTDRAERRRLAIESGFREWEQLHKLAERSPRGAEMYPPVLFVHFNNELLRLIESSEGLTPETYRNLTKKRDGLRSVIREDSRRRAAELRNEEH